MRLPSILLAVFILPVTLVQAQAQAQPFPYDPYPWCAVYGGRGGGVRGPPPGAVRPRHAGPGP